MTDYAIVDPDDIDDVYAGTDVPGEFRPLTRALACEQLAATLIRVPPHCDFEQGTGQLHHEAEELYLVTRGTLTMRFGDDVVPGPRDRGARRAADAALASQRGRRADGDVGDLAEADRGDATKIDDFWEASPAARHMPGRRRTMGDPGIPGFGYTTIEVGPTTYRPGVAGSGPAVLLLHGFPQTPTAGTRSLRRSPTGTRSSSAT